MNGLISVIKLQLNPREPVAQTIISLLERIPALAENSKAGSKLWSADNLLIVHCQWLLKDEWDKVKFEAKMFGTRRARKHQMERDAEYQQFLKSNDPTSIG